MRQDINAICEECNEAITNPICPDCLERHAIAWLRERKKDCLILRVKDRMNVIKKQSSENSSVNCVICRNKLSICPHCTSKELLKILHGEKRLIEDFMILFSYVY